MTEVSQQAAEFLENVFEMTGLQLRVGVKQGIAGEVLDIEAKAITDLIARLDDSFTQAVQTILQCGGRVVVRAIAPQSEMLRYAIDLRSISRGRGTFEVEPSHYEEVPAHVAQQIIADYQKHREEQQH